MPLNYSDSSSGRSDAGKERIFYLWAVKCWLSFLYSILNLVLWENMKITWINTRNRKKKNCRLSNNLLHAYFPLLMISLHCPCTKNQLMLSLFLGHLNYRPSLPTTLSTLIYHSNQIKQFNQIILKLKSNSNTNTHKNKPYMNIVADE